MKISNDWKENLEFSYLLSLQHASLMVPLKSFTSSVNLISPFASHNDHLSLQAGQTLLRSEDERFFESFFMYLTRAVCFPLDPFTRRRFGALDAKILVQRLLVDTTIMRSFFQG